MPLIKVDSSIGKSRILVGGGMLDRLPDEIARTKTDRVFTIYDANLFALYGREISKLLPSDAETIVIALGFRITDAQESKLPVFTVLRATSKNV